MCFPVAQLVTNHLMQTVAGASRRRRVLEACGEVFQAVCAAAKESGVASGIAIEERTVRDALRLR